MTRLEKRHAIIPGYPDPNGLLALCQEWRETINRANDNFMGSQELTQAKLFLETVLDSWDTSVYLSDCDDAYDIAVRKLVVAMRDIIVREISRQNR